MNKDLWRRLSMLTAVIVVKGLVWYGCWGPLDLRPVAFLPKVGPAVVLKDRDNLVDSAVPGLTVSSKCWPLASGLTVSSKCWPLVLVNVAGTKGLLEGVFKTFLWCPSVTVASGEFTIQSYLGQVMPPSPFWRHTLPSIAVTSATWPLCR